jgi:DNA end-binding protein Ku
MKQLAAHIGDTKAAHFDPQKFEDHHEAALIRLLRAKQKGKAFKEPEEAPQPSWVINLMDALRASIGQEKAEAEKAPKRKAVGKKRA